MKKVLIISGHTDLTTSVANKAILEKMAELLPEAEIIKLDELYPDYKIDVEREQQRLVEADIIVLQYPLFWYSIPSILQKYIEDVFKHGFSHGSTGKKLMGKTFVQSFTTGAPEAAFSPEAMGITLENLLLPLQTACRLTNMEWSGYLACCGVGYTTRTNIEVEAEQTIICRQHAERLCQLIGALS